MMDDEETWMRMEDVMVLLYLRQYHGIYARPYRRQ
jgi:hypothetical protein